MKRALFGFFLLLIFLQEGFARDSTPKQIGLFIVATGKYIQFVNPLITSARHWFCTDHHVVFFVFTDQEMQEEFDVIRIPVRHLGWPYATLMRFHMYAEYQEQFDCLDYIFAIDADALFVAPVGEEIFSDRVFTLHPGFVNRAGTYERNPLSAACVASHEGTFYFAGGFYGGSPKEFFRFVNTAKEKVDQDLAKGCIALWHDESHLNRYAIDYPPTLILTPSYCYPESWRLPYVKKILVLDKDHCAMRN